MSQWELLLLGPERVHSAPLWFILDPPLLWPNCFLMLPVTSAVVSRTILCHCHAAALTEAHRGWDFVLQMDSTGRIVMAVLQTWGGVHWIFHNAHVAWLFRRKSFFILYTYFVFPGYTESSSTELECAYLR